MLSVHLPLFATFVSSTCPVADNKTEEIAPFERSLQPDRRPSRRRASTLPQFIDPPEDAARRRKVGTPTSQPTGIHASIDRPRTRHTTMATPENPADMRGQTTPDQPAVKREQTTPDRPAVKREQTTPDQLAVKREQTTPGQVANMLEQTTKFSTILETALAKPRLDMAAMREQIIGKLHNAPFDIVQSDTTPSQRPLPRHDEPRAYQLPRQHTRSQAAASDHHNQKRQSCARGGCRHGR